MERPINFTLGGVSVDIKLDELVMVCKARGMRPKFIVQCNPQDYFGAHHPYVSYVRATTATPRGYVAIGEDPAARENWD
jgi:hypothetical protein